MTREMVSDCAPRGGNAFRPVNWSCNFRCAQLPTIVVQIMIMKRFSSPHVGIIGKRRKSKCQFHICLPEQRNFCNLIKTVSGCVNWQSWGLCESVIKFVSSDHGLWVANRRTSLACRENRLQMAMYTDLLYKVIPAKMPPKKWCSIWSHSNLLPNHCKWCIGRFCKCHSVMANKVITVFWYMIPW